MAETTSQEANSLLNVRPAYTSRNLSHYTTSPFLDNLAATDLPWNLLTFLSIAQSLKIDFLPITWAPALKVVGWGATSEIRQSLVNVETAFAYKRLLEKGKVEEEKAFRTLIAEVMILGQEGIRANENLVRLEGICWDVSPPKEKVWPVFVFEKAEMGNLETFMQERPIGKNLGFEERVELCADAGKGICMMHSCSIAHGDIKPLNVLIFKKKDGETTDGGGGGGGGGGGYTAKVTDFGYSVIFRHPDSQIPMPKTPLWAAPEQCHLTDLAGAMKMDAYSFGLLCLWLLFYAGKCTIDKFHEELSSEDDKLEIARRKVDEVISAEEVKGQLRRFFEKALAKEKVNREGDFRVLLSLLAPHRAETDKMSTPAMENFHISSSEGFQLATSIAQLYLTDFRVRTHITSCLSESVARSPPTDTENSIIQLAICYKLGFGVPRDEIKASNLMKQISKQPEDFQPIVNHINEHGSDVIFHDGNYKYLTGQGFVPRIDYGQYYRERQQLEKVERIYKREISDLSAALGTDHGIIESLKSQLSAIYADQGRWSEAETLRSQILETNTRLLGPGASVTQFSKAALAEASRKLGKWTQAETLLREALEARTRTLGPHHPHSLSAMVELAAAIRRQGRHDEARELEERVVEISTRVFGPEYEFSLIAMANLASTYREEGRWTEAERIQVQVLGTSKKVLGDKHPDTLTDMGNLASTYVRLGNFSKAGELQTKLLEIRKEELGDKHPDTLASKSGLSFIYRSQGQLDEANKLDFEVLDDSIEVLGLDHPDTLSCMGNVAEALWVQGQREEAEMLERQVVDRTLRLLGPDHPDTLISQGNLAVTYRNLGKWKEAETLELKVLEGRRKLLGENHQDTLTSKENLAITWENLGRYSEAEELERSVLEVKKRTMGEDHIQTVLSCRNLAAMLVDQERWGEVVELAEPALERARRMLSEKHPITLSCMRSLTLAYLHCDRISEAESLAQLNLETSNRLHGLEHPDTILAKRNFSLVLAATEMRLREAVKMQKEVLEECRRVFGESHVETLRCMRNLVMMRKNAGMDDEGDDGEGVEEMRRRLVEISSGMRASGHPEGGRLVRDLLFGEEEEEEGVGERT